MMLSILPNHRREQKMSILTYNQNREHIVGCTVVMMPPTMNDDKRRRSRRRRRRQRNITKLQKFITKSIVNSHLTNGLRLNIRKMVLESL